MVLDSILMGLTVPFAYCWAICTRMLLGKFIISSPPKADDEILVLEPVPDDNRELVELEAPREDPEVDTETPLWPWLFKEEFVEVVAAIGAETLLVWLELGSGSAIVTGCGCCSSPFPLPVGNCTCGRS